MDTEQARELDLCDFTTQLDDTYHALRAFNYLIDHMGEFGGSPIPIISYGIGHLLRRQLDDLEESKNTVFKLVSQLRKAEDAASDNRGIPEGWVTSPVIRSVHDLPPDHPARSPLRGADLGAVARDTNLSETTVRRVVERLLAEPAPDPQAIARNG